MKQVSHKQLFLSPAYKHTHTHTHTLHTQDEISFAQMCGVQSGREGSRKQVELSGQLSAPMGHVYIWTKNEDSVWRSVAYTHTFVNLFIEKNDIFWCSVEAYFLAPRIHTINRCAYTLDGSRKKMYFVLPTETVLHHFKWKQTDTVAVDGNRLLSYLCSTLITPLVLLLLLPSESNLQPCTGSLRNNYFPCEILPSMKPVRALQVNEK